MTADDNLPGNLVDAREEERRARCGYCRGWGHVRESTAGSYICPVCGGFGFLLPPAPLVDRDTGDEG